MKQPVTALFLVVMLLAGLVLAGGCSESSAIPAGTTLVIATNMDYPPFGYLDEDGNLAGFDYQYGRLLCEEIEASCQWRWASFEEVVSGTSRGEYDLAVNSLTKTDSLEEMVSFSVPYYHAYGQFVRLSGSGAELDDAGVVATHRDSLFEFYLSTEGFSHLEVLPLGSLEEIIKAVGTGEADLGMVDDVIADLIVSRSLFILDESMGDFEKVGGPIIPAPNSIELEHLGSGAIGIIVPKSNAHLLPDIDRAIKEINQGQAIAEISQRYFGRNIVNKD